MVLVIDQTATINFTLKPAAVAETITVDRATPPIVDTTASTVSTSVSNQQIQDLPVASRRWIDLAMLTPGTSQDNIRGFFYRGNVNIGGGAREYSNGFVVDGVNNTWAQMGEPRQNFAMDAIREFKVSTSNYKAEYGLATGGLLTVVSKSGTNQWHGSGLLFVRDKALTARTLLRSGEARTSAAISTAARWAGPIVRNRTHFFAAYEGTDENLFYTVSDGRHLAAVRRHLRERAESLDLLDESRSSADADADAVRAATGRRTNTVRSSRPGGRDASDQQLRLRGAAVVGCRRSHLGAQPARAERLPLPVRATRSSRWRRRTATDRGSPATSAKIACRYCTPVFIYPSITVGGCGNSQMGPEARVELKNDFSYLMNKWGGTHQWKMGVDYSYVTFSSDNLNSPLGQLDVPARHAYDANDPSTWPTQYLEHAADLRRASR